MKHIFLTLATTTALFLLLSTTANGDDNVYDVMGDPLVAGGQYYMVPYLYTEAGGGFNWKENRHIFAPCPEYYIYQVNDNTDFGQATAFYPTNARQNKITLSSNVNIAFPDVNPPASPVFLCPESSNVWKVENNKQVLLGGVKGGRDSKSVFTIKELDVGGYSINFCGSHLGCGSLGIDSSSGENKLVFNGTDPLAVAFESQQIFLNRIAQYVA